MSPETTLTVMSHKTPQVQEKVGTVAVAVTNAATQVTRVVTGTPVPGRRGMFVLNEAPAHTINRVSQQNQTATIQSEYRTILNPNLKKISWVCIYCCYLQRLVGLWQRWKQNVIMNNCDCKLVRFKVKWVDCNCRKIIIANWRNSKSNIFHYLEYLLNCSYHWSHNVSFWWILIFLNWWRLIKISTNWRTFHVLWE